MSSYGFELQSLGSSSMRLSTSISLRVHVYTQFRWHENPSHGYDCIASHSKQLHFLLWLVILTSLLCFLWAIPDFVLLDSSEEVYFLIGKNSNPGLSVYLLVDIRLLSLRLKLCCILQPHSMDRNHHFHWHHYCQWLMYRSKHYQIDWYAYDRYDDFPSQRLSPYWWILDLIV